MLFIAFAALLLALAALPAVMVHRNLQLFQCLPNLQREDVTLPGISVLIPARDEESGIEAAIASVLAGAGVELEVLVMDDHSQDRTAHIVGQIAGSDGRVHLYQAPPLPSDWNGKQHACWQLASHAKFDWLLFLDADVRLNRDALARAVAYGVHSQSVGLLSGFPKQEMVTWAEKLMIPMMHFVLLGYLPLDRMRASCEPAFGAGCGQFFLARRKAYFDSGGHQSIRASRHDGLKLPRSFRAAGFTTDVFDARDIAHVRMYDSAPAVVRGLLKNATEGIANPRLIVLFTILLAGSAVWPLMTLGHAVFWGWPRAAIALLVLATILSFLPRWWIARRLRQPALGVMLHPLGVMLFLAIQWLAFVRESFGCKAIAWRGRS